MSRNEISSHKQPSLAFKSMTSARECKWNVSKIYKGISSNASITIADVAPEKIILFFLRKSVTSPPNDWNINVHIGFVYFASILVTSPKEGVKNANFLKFPKILNIFIFSQNFFNKIFFLILLITQITQCPPLAQRCPFIFMLPVLFSFVKFVKTNPMCAMNQ